MKIRKNNSFKCIDIYFYFIVIGLVLVFYMINFD